MGEKNTIKGLGPEPVSASSERPSDGTSVNSRSSFNAVAQASREETQAGITPSSSRRLDTVFQGTEACQPSERPLSEARLTERGLGSAPPKIVTKPGVAPASEPPPKPPPSDCVDDEETGDIQPNVLMSEFEEQAAASLALEDGRDELTPAEVESRSAFRTAPGGGKNRVSGGRASAAAYVSPSTLAPGQAVRPATAKVQLHEQVRSESRSFHTEPSLLRRRASSIPPDDIEDTPAFGTQKWLLLGSLAALLGGGIAFFAAAQMRPEESGGAELSQASERRALGQERKAKDLSNTPAMRPSSNAGSVQGTALVQSPETGGSPSPQNSAAAPSPPNSATAPSPQNSATAQGAPPSESKSELREEKAQPPGVVAPAQSPSTRMPKTAPSPRPRSAPAPAPAPATPNKDDLWLD